MSYEIEKVSVPRLARLEKGQKGYGFNLHGDKGKTVQTISAVDKDSAAELGGLRVGDIVIEVNGENVESQSHMEVVNLIKKKSGETTLLVCDKDTLAYLKEKERPCTADMANLTTVIPPEQPSEVANGSATIEEVQQTSVESVESAPAVVEDPTPTPPEPVTKVDDQEPAPTNGTEATVNDTTPDEVKELNNVLDEQEKPAEQPEPPVVHQIEEPAKPSEPVEPPKPDKSEDRSDGLKFDMQEARNKAKSGKKRSVKTEGSNWGNKVSMIDSL